jgi:hypothetical protein
MKISFDSKVRVPDDVLVSQLDGESVLLNLQSESYHGLNEVGTRFWELLTASESIRSAYEALLAEYAVDPETLRGDLIELVGALQEKGLVELA